MQVKYISQKYTFGKYTFVKYTFEKYALRFTFYALRVRRRGSDAILWGRWERRKGRRGGGNRKDDRWGESKEQEPANLQKTDEETR